MQSGRSWLTWASMWPMCTQARVPDLATPQPSLEHASWLPTHSTDKTRMINDAAAWFAPIVKQSFGRSAALLEKVWQ